MTGSFRHLDHYSEAGIIVLRQEMAGEAKQNDMFNPEDVEQFVSAVVPAAILSAINAYPISFVTEVSIAQENDFQQFRTTFNNHTMRLQELVTKDIALASAGKILMRNRYRGMKKTRQNQIQFAVSAIASAAIDAAKNLIEEGDSVLFIILEAVLQDANEYTNCRWIENETVHLLRSLVLEEFEEKGLIVSFNGKKITKMVRNCI